HGLQSCSRHHFQSTCLTKSTSSLTAKMAPGTNNDGAGDSVENEDFEYEQGNDPKQSQRMLETLGIINVATKSKRVSAANALGFPSKRQKKDESALQKRAPRGQGPNARERIHRGTSDACDEKKEAEENVVAKGDEGAHDGFNEDNAQDGGEGRVRTMVLMAGAWEVSQALTQRNWNAMKTLMTVKRRHTMLKRTTTTKIQRWTMMKRRKRRDEKPRQEGAGAGAVAGVGPQANQALVGAAGAGEVSEVCWDGKEGGHAPTRRGVVLW
ncbi:hypothetical protein Vafri_10944, partial [Volvox africanus]